MSREAVLVHAPFGRDAELICQVLGRGEIAAHICATMDDLCARLGEETGAALISDEALTKASVAALAGLVSAQPAWSDLPLIVTTTGGEVTRLTQQKLSLIAPLGNVTLLERPLRTATLISAVRTLLRARRRQHQLRDHFAERERLLKELERSNDELGQFAHVVSHDLQAPIRMISTFSEILSTRYRGQLGENGVKILDTIQDGALRMDELVKTLLHYATLGQTPVADSDVDLGTVVSAVLATLQPAIDDVAAEITVGPLPSVRGDPVQLQRVFQNIISNALKYARSEEPLRVCVCARKVDSEWRISVADNGPGIAPEYHERVFQPLKRLHGREIAGTGMGLAVCRKIIERHGGRIWVEPEVRHGATFTFSFITPETP
jgi:signal transduction histidine kinase